MYYYNNKRRHTSLNMSPVQFRKNYYIKKEASVRLSKEMGT